MGYLAFIVHSTEDESVLEEVHESLSARGMDCFIAERERKPGQLITAKIEEAILESDVVLVIWTEAAAASPFVNQEIGYARGKKDIVPLVRRGTALQAFLYGMDSIEFDDGDLHERVRELAEFLELRRSDKESVESLGHGDTEAAVLGERVEREDGPSFTILKVEDKSHLRAKRYSANVLVYGQIGREDLLRVIVAAVDRARHLEYYRNVMVKERWGGKRAQVVWLFVYSTLEDIQLANWVCRAQWIDPGLDRDARPMEIRGDDRANGIVVEWNENYEDMRRLYQDKVLDKGAYLKRADEIVMEAARLIREAYELFQAYTVGHAAEKELVEGMQRLGEKFRPLYLHSGELLPPYECGEFDHTFQGLMANGDNVFVYFTSRGLETWNHQARMYLTRKSVEAALADLELIQVLRKRLE